VAEGTIGWKEVAVAGISILASISTAALWAVRDADLARFDERCEVMSGAVRDIRTHDDRIEAKVDGALISVGSAIANMDAHRREADVHIRRIGSNEDRVNDLERKVSGLLSSPSARPDSYSGTDARKRADVVDAELRHHDRRLDALEVETFGRANGNGKVRK
jgi:hypothetical protein